MPFGTIDSENAVNRMDSGAELLKSIRKTISPTTWRISGGPQDPLQETGGFLVVRHHPWVHVELERYLDRILREGVLDPDPQSAPATTSPSDQGNAP